jgi:hypothetical protein
VVVTLTPLRPEATKNWGNDATTYYEQGASGWNSNEWTLNYSITKTLPVGSYVLKIAARASTGTTATLKATVDGTDYYEDLPNFGATGKGITTTGVASFDDADDFANSDNGYGWQWRYLFFYVATEGDVTLQIDASADSKEQWCSFGDVALISNVNLSALTTAYLGLSMETLGFQKDEYAPYTNAALLKAYADAHDILYEVTEAEDQAQVNDLASTLTAAAWVQNADDMDAIYNGMFGDGLTGWTRATGWGENWESLGEPFATGYYNWPGNMTYGNTGVYTMPLAANQKYKLTASYRSQANNSNDGVKLSVLNGSNQGLSEVSFTENNSASEWKTVNAYFETGAASDYVLTMNNSGNTVWTNVHLVKANDSEVTLNEAVAFTPVDNTFYQTLNLTRSIAKGWNTIVLPFSMTAAEITDVLGEGTLYQFVDADNGSLEFSEATALEAHVPYLFNANDAKNISAQVIATRTITEPTNSLKTNGTDYNFVGTYTPYGKNADGNPIVIGNDYVLGADAAFHQTTVKNAIKAFRAYIQANEATDVKAMAICIDGEETAIQTINGEQAIKDGVIYNLAGQRVSKAQKGLYIVNGKKVLVK